MNTNKHNPSQTQEKPKNNKEHRSKSPFIEHYDTILPMIRKVFFYGTYSQKDIADEQICGRARYYEIKDDMKYAFGDLLEEHKNSRSQRALRLRHDHFADPQRAFLKLFQLRTFTSGKRLMYFCFILQQLRMNGKMTATQLDREADFYDNAFDDEADLNAERGGEDDNDKIIPIRGVLRGALEIMTKYGILLKNEDDLYQIADDAIFGDVLDEETRFALLPLVDLCTNLYPLSICGSGIRSKLDLGYVSPFLYKYRFLGHCFDDEKTWRLLLALSSRRPLEVMFLTRKGERKTASQFIPYRMITDKKSGRQYLFGTCLGKNRHENYILRLDHILKIEFDSPRFPIPDKKQLNEWFHEETDHSFTGIARRKHLEKGTLLFDRNKLSEVKRQFPDGVPVSLSEDIERLDFEVQDIWGLKPWLCSHADGMLLLDSTDPTAEDVSLTINQWAEMYAQAEPLPKTAAKGCSAEMNDSTAKGKKEKKGKNKKSGNSPQSIDALSDLSLSNDFNNFFLIAVFNVFNHMVNSKTSAKRFEKDLYYFTEDNEMLFKNVVSKLMDEINMLVDTESPDGSWKLFHQTPLPICFTTVERIYLKAILRTRYGEIFLTEKQRSGLLNCLRDLPDIDFEECCIMAPHQPKKSFSDDTIRKIRLLLEAVENNTEIVYSNRTGKRLYVDSVGFPVKIEYAADSDRFMLSLWSESEQRPIKVNIATMFDVRCTDNIWDNPLSPLEMMKDKYMAEPITMLLSPSSANFERALFAFSLYDSEIERMEDGRYLFRLRYYDFDQREIVYKICSFGKDIRVLSPAAIVASVAAMPDRHKAFAQKAQKCISGNLNDLD